MGRAAKRTTACEAGERALTHDLANLVQAVNGNLELLAARTEDEPGRRYLANARSAVRQLAELTRELRAKEIERND